MKDITDLMLKFKEAVRHSWNEYFRNSESPMSPEIQEAFSSVERRFFQIIVLSPLGIAERFDEYRKYPLPFIIIKPDNSDYVREIPLYIGTKEKNGNISFEQLVVATENNQMRFEFYDFFDWYSYGYIDFPYVRAKIIVLPKIIEAQGKIALIEQRYCKFFLVNNK